MYGQGPQQYGYGIVQVPQGSLMCPRCGFVGQPFVTQRISVAGWIVFTLLLFVCLPFFWVGLLMKETVSKCPRCLQ